jgi:hypothetical protein
MRFLKSKTMGPPADRRFFIPFTTETDRYVDFSTFRVWPTGRIG